MVAGIPRSVSLPVPSTSNAKGRALEKSFHVRSVSLPSRSHPIISQVEGGIRALNTWQAESKSSSTSSLCAGLELLEQLYTSVNDLFQLPQSQDSIRCNPATDSVMEDFLRIADAHGNFRSNIISLKEHLSAAQVAVRRRDDACLASCAKLQRNTVKQLVKLASTLQNVFRPLSTMTNFKSDAQEAELFGILREVTLVTVSTSTMIFLVISAAASSATSMVMACVSGSQNSWTISPLKRLSSSIKKKAIKVDAGVALQSLQALEECLEAVQSKSERVCRTLVNSRVTLLNALTL